MGFLVTAGVVAAVLALKNVIHRKRSYDLYKIPAARGAVPVLGHTEVLSVRSSGSPARMPAPKKVRINNSSRVKYIHSKIAVSSVQAVPPGLRECS